MDKKNIFVVGDSSGIGLEIVKKQRVDQNEIYVGSRTSGFLSDYPDIHHLSIDITGETPELDGLPDVINGFVYCPATIVLKPFQRLTMADFRNNFCLITTGISARTAMRLSQPSKKRSTRNLTLLLLSASLSSPTNTPI